LQVDFDMAIDRELIRRVAHDAIEGGIAGLAATAPMTAFVEAANDIGFGQPQHPTRRPDAGEAGVSPSASGEHETIVSVAARYFFYGAAGAGYGLCFHGRRRNVFTGAAFGCAVWLASRLRSPPAHTIQRPIARHALERGLVVAGAHFLWGAALGKYLSFKAGSNTRSIIQPTCNDVS
jgi:hypothetical protein